MKMTETNYYERNRDFILNRAKDYYKNDIEIYLNRKKVKERIWKKWIL